MTLPKTTLFIKHFLSFECETIKPLLTKHSSKKMKINDKAWRRVGESPITTNLFLSFVVSQHRQVFLKNICHAKQQTTNYYQETRSA